MLVYLNVELPTLLLRSLKLYCLNVWNLSWIQLTISLDSRRAILLIIVY